MNDKFLLLYNDMLNDIDRCLKLPHPEKENAENCFWIARNYAEKLDGIVKANGFKDEKEEIEFFKDIKPKFTSYIEFYVILAEALQFVPTHQPLPSELSSVDDARWQQANMKTIAEYWDQEAQRFNRFCQKNRVFVEYIERGEDRNDALYFLRENDLATGNSTIGKFDPDPGFSTSYEQVLRSYLAHKNYKEYCESKIKQLIVKNPE